MSWYSDNARRAFPFVDAATAPLPDGAVVDFGCEFGRGAGFVPGVHSVWLSSVSRATDMYWWTFKCDAPGVDSTALLFYFPAGSAEYTASRRTSDDTSSDGTPCGTPLWTGFLVIGDLEVLELANGESLTFLDGAVPVEPAVVIDTSEVGVDSLSIYNVSRVRTPEIVNCSSEVPYEATLDPAATCLTGDLAFRNGYNCVLLQNDGDNSLTFGASVGAGAGEPCGEVPTNTNEAVNSSAGPLSGGPLCHEVLRSLNGVGGRILIVEGRNGIDVKPGPGPGQLEIDIHLNGLAVCHTSSVTV